MCAQVIPERPETHVKARSDLVEREKLERGGAFVRLHRRSPHPARRFGCIICGRGVLIARVVQVGNRRKVSRHRVQGCGLGSAHHPNPRPELIGEECARNGLIRLPIIAVLHRERMPFHRNRGTCGGDNAVTAFARS
jgi:hypothetical protein